MFLRRFAEPLKSEDEIRNSKENPSELVLARLLLARRSLNERIACGVWSRIPDTK
jgi:hypothetical protein